MKGYWSMLALAIFSATAFVASPAQTVTSLAAFDLSNGAGPGGGLVQAFDGSFFGTTGGGGSSNNGGAVFQFVPGNSPVALYKFCGNKSCPTGGYPASTLVLAPSGLMYGTAAGGGNDNAGTVFKVTPSGQFHLVYSFCVQVGCPDGQNLDTGLSRAFDGSFYGSAFNAGGNGYGTIFRVTATGQTTVEYSFCAKTNCLDGAAPSAPVTQGVNGNFYGTTIGGGTGGINAGTVFELSKTGALTTLYNFCSQTKCADGQRPASKLLLASDGNFYGTTSQGGTNGQGTIFRITPQGTLTKLYDLCSLASCADGAGTYSDLMQATDGKIYGVALQGGANNLGTIFQLTLAGGFNTLYSFSGTDGAYPAGGLIQATDGNLYGTTESGGLVTTCQANLGGCGTIYELNMGLSPLVKLVQPWGKVGTTAILLGTNLSGATSVAFNGTSASFTVVSATEISATVPAGAVSGKVQVVTPSGTLSSNVAFVVVP